MLAVRQFEQRHQEFQGRGLELVRVFYSPRDSLAAFASTPFPVLADPERRVYAAFAVRRGLRALLAPAAVRRVREARRLGLRPRWRDAIRDGFRGFPADFLIGSGGELLQVRYGSHFADSVVPEAVHQWLDEIEGKARDSTQTVW